MEHLWIEVYCIYPMIALFESQMGFVSEVAFLESGVDGQGK